MRLKGASGALLGSWLGDGKLVVHQGGLEVEAGGATIAGDVSLPSGDLAAESVTATTGGLSVVAGGAEVDGGSILRAATGGTLSLSVEHTSLTQGSSDTVMRVRGESTTTSGYKLMQVEAKTDGATTYTERFSVAGTGETTVTGTLALPAGSYVDGQVGASGHPADGFMGAFRHRLANVDGASDDDGTVYDMTHEECGSVVSLGNPSSTAGFTSPASVVRLPEVTAATSKHGCEVTVVLQGTGCLPPTCVVAIRQSLGNLGDPTVLYGHYLDHGGPGQVGAPTWETLYVTTFGAQVPNYQLQPSSSAFEGQWIKLASYPGASKQWVVLGGNGKWETALIP